MRAERGRPGQAGDRIAAALMLLPTVVPYTLFALLPIGWLVWYSLHRADGFTPPQFVGLDNYQRVLRDELWRDAVLTTLQYAGGRILVEIPLSLGLAYVLHRRLRGHAFFKTVYFLPNVLSPAIVGIIFAFFLREVGGPLNGLLASAGLVQAPVNFLGDAGNALLSLMGVGIWRHFGINTLLFLVGMLTIPKELLESAAVEGCGAWRTFRHIVLPLLRPVTRIVILLSIIGILRSFDLVKTLTDGGPAGATEVMFTYLFRYFFNPTAVPQIGYAAALGVAASVVVGVVSVAYLALARRGGAER